MKITPLFNKAKSNFCAKMSMNDRQCPVDFAYVPVSHDTFTKQTAVNLGLAKYATRTVRIDNKPIKAIATEERIIANIKKDIGDAIEKKDYGTIFKYFGLIAPEKPHKKGKYKSEEPQKKGVSEREKPKRINEKGVYTLDKFVHPQGTTFAALGIDEQDMIDHVSHIEYNADFSHCPGIKTFHRLKSIGGVANFVGSDVESFGTLSVLNNANLGHSKFKSLFGLRRVIGFLNLYNSQVEDFATLKTVGKKLILGQDHFKFFDIDYINLGDLESIGGDVEIVGKCPLTPDDFYGINVSGNITKLRNEDL